MDAALQGPARGDNPQVKPEACLDNGRNGRDGPKNAKQGEDRPGRANGQAGEKPD